jgi:hypothetical protein
MQLLIMQFYTKRDKIEPAEMDFLKAVQTLYCIRLDKIRNEDFSLEDDNYDHDNPSEEPSNKLPRYSFFSLNNLVCYLVGK